MSTYKFLKRHVSNALFIPVYYALYKKEFSELKIASIKETMRQIQENGKSLSRFGDGELKYLINAHQNNFQNNDKKLSMELLRVLNSSRKELLVGIPGALKNPSYFSTEMKHFWEKDIGIYGKQWISLLDKNKQFYDMNVSIPYTHHVNGKIGRYVFNKWKEIFNNKSILIIEGETTKFGLGNDLLDSAKRLYRLECPSTDAFFHYDKIMSGAIKAIKKTDSELVLIALGPTATIMADDLNKKTGIQCIDIGHLDLDYSYYLAGDIDGKSYLPGKAVHDENGEMSKDEFRLNMDSNYKKEIIAHIR